MFLIEYWNKQEKEKLIFAGLFSAALIFFVIFLIFFYHPRQARGQIDLIPWLKTNHPDWLVDETIGSYGNLPGGSSAWPPFIDTYWYPWRIAQEFPQLIYNPEHSNTTNQYERKIKFWNIGRDLANELEGKDVIIDGGADRIDKGGTEGMAVVSLDGLYDLNSLTLKNGVALTHGIESKNPDGTPLGLQFNLSGDLNGDSLSIDGTSRIMADGKGYRGGLSGEKKSKQIVCPDTPANPADDEVEVREVTALGGNGYQSTQQGWPFDLPNFDYLKELVELPGDGDKLVTHEAYSCNLNVSDDIARVDACGDRAHINDSCQTNGGHSVCPSPLKRFVCGHNTKTLGGTSGDPTANFYGGSGGGGGGGGNIVEMNNRDANAGAAGYGGYGWGGNHILDGNYDSSAGGGGAGYGGKGGNGVNGSTNESKTIAIENLSQLGNNLLGYGGGGGVKARVTESATNYYLGKNDGVGNGGGKIYINAKHNNGSGKVYIGGWHEDPAENIDQKLWNGNGMITANAIGRLIPESDHEYMKGRDSGSGAGGSVEIIADQLENCGSIFANVSNRVVNYGPQGGSGIIKIKVDKLIAAAPGRVSAGSAEIQRAKNLSLRNLGLADIEFNEFDNNTPTRCESLPMNVAQVISDGALNINGPNVPKFTYGANQDSATAYYFVRGNITNIYEPYSHTQSGAVYGFAEIDTQVIFDQGINNLSIKSGHASWTFNDESPIYPSNFEDNDQWSDWNEAKQEFETARNAPIGDLSYYKFGNNKVLRFATGGVRFQKGNSRDDFIMRIKLKLTAPCGGTNKYRVFNNSRVFQDRTNNTSTYVSYQEKNVGVATSDFLEFEVENTTPCAPEGVFGDVFGATGVNISQKTVGIVASGGTVVNDDVLDKYDISPQGGGQPYIINPKSTANWDRVTNINTGLMTQKTQELINEKAHKIQANNISDVLNNLNNNSISRDNQDLSTDPEGDVYFCDGDLALDSDTKIKGRGTIIVKGDLTINGNLSYDDEKSSVGFIVLKRMLGGGKVVVGSGVNKIIGALFAPDGNITVSLPTSQSQFVFEGLMIAKEVVVKRNQVSFQYSARIDSSPPPGFYQTLAPLYQF